jgi:cytochrome c
MRTIIHAAALLLLGLSSASAFADGDTVKGKKLFTRCGACHAVTGQNKVGPGLLNIVGRPAATNPDYKYSAALKASGLTWDEATLDTFLKAPTAVVKGARMSLAVKKDEDRADIIAYLKTLSAK